MKRAVLVAVLFVGLVGTGVVIAGENLLSNSSFEVESGESIPFDWNTWTKRMVLFDTIEESGGNVFKISSFLLDGRGSLRRLGVPVEGGKVYRLEVMYKANLSEPHPNDWVPSPAVVRIQWFKDGPTEGNIASDADYVAELNPEGVRLDVREGSIHVFGEYQQSEWAELWANAAAPEGAKYALLDFLIWSAQGEIYWKLPVFAEAADYSK